jgi:F-type H+-transporting ATPase subunit delta
MALIKKALERRTGKEILLETKVQPDILGGVIARVGDQVIDGSIRYRLSALRQQLLAGAAGSNIDFLSQPESGSGSTAEPSSIQ